MEGDAARRLQDQGFSAFHHSDWHQAVINDCSKMEGYHAVREGVAQRVMRASRIADRLGVAHQFRSFPAPAVGGPVIPVELFHAILHDTSHGGLPRHVLIDAIDQLVGATEDKLKEERLNLINPVYWIKETIIAIIRIPFLLIEASGFDVSKVEENLFAKLFKILEILALIWIGTHILGLTTEDLLKFLRLRDG